MNLIHTTALTTACLALTAGGAWATPNDSAANNGELIIVEPMHTTPVRASESNTGANFGAQVRYAMAPVYRDTDGDSGTPEELVYEFAVLYVTYPGGPTAPQIFEVGGANLIDPTEAVSVEVMPLVASSVQTPSSMVTSAPPNGFWDGVSSEEIFVDSTANLDLGTGVRRAAVVRVPADFVQNHPAFASTVSSAGVIGVVRGVHKIPGFTDAATGYFQSLKRNFVGAQPVAASFDNLPTPILFSRQGGDPTREALIVEPQSSAFLGIEEPVNVGMLNRGLPQTSLVAAEDCGGRDGDRTPVDCYEFQVMYATYDSAGAQTLHVPNPDPNDPVQAAIEGNLDVELIPLDGTPTGSFPFGTWDGKAAHQGGFYVWTSRNGLVDPNTPYEVAVVRIPLSVVQRMEAQSGGIPGGVLALIQARHENPETSSTSLGLFSPFKRVSIFNQDLAATADQAPMPVFLRTSMSGADAAEVLLVEPLNFEVASFGGIVGAKIPVVRAVVNEFGEEVYQFAVTYVDYPPVGRAQVHGTDPRSFLIEGDLGISIISNRPGDPPVSGEWDHQAQAVLRATDITGTAVLGRDFRVARIDVPKAMVLASISVAPGAPLPMGVIAGVHTRDDGEIATGFYNRVKGMLVHQKDAADLLDSVPTPVFFQP